ncbi:MAG: DUF3311 domain-containing protein [Anaerovorax sp.]
MRKSRIPTVIIAFCLPMLAIFACFPLYNRIEPFVFGFSFNYFWIFAWLFLTSLCLYIGFKLDPYNDPEVAEESAEKLKKAIAIIEKDPDGKGGTK